jgi:hypothetical protein
VKYNVFSLRQNYKFTDKAEIFMRWLSMHPSFAINFTIAAGATYVIIGFTGGGYEANGTCFTVVSTF